MIHYPLLTPQRELAIMHKAGGLPLAPVVFTGTLRVEVSGLVSICIYESCFSYVYASGKTCTP